MAETGKLGALYADLKAGKLSRRDFVQRAAALGVSMSVLQFIMVNTPVAAAPAARGGKGKVAAQQAASRPTAGTDGQERGAGGELKLIQWQAPTHLSIHVSTGTKDSLAAALVTEPLMNYMPDGSLVPTLVKEVPTKENGLLAEDLTSVTYNLLEGITWSDGEPFTADDVVFTWNWINTPDNASINQVTYGVIQNAEAIDELTVKLTFKSPQLGWYVPFTGTYGGGVYPAHVLSAGGEANTTFRQNPVGTGPYVVESFKENDQVIYVANERYREPNKPFFARVNLKGGGDAASAARAVLQTGDYDYAWNLQVEPEILRDLEEGGKGTISVPTGSNIEAIRFNFSDPNKEVDGQRSQWQTPHPILSDIAVRRALSLASDRKTIAERFYLAPGEKDTPNILSGIPALESDNTSWEYDLDKARQTLEDAGWTLDGDVRTKDGMELRLGYTTTINAVRQKTQAVIKQAWEEIGVKVQLKQVDAGIFFDSAAGNDQTGSHNYSDIQMFTNGPTSPFPLSYVQVWYSNNGTNIAQKENGWGAPNEQRYNNPEYDRLYDTLITETDTEKAAEYFIQMNDILINDVAVVPLVLRAADKYAFANTLNDENGAVSAWETNYWNIANWNRKA